MRSIRWAADDPGAVNLGLLRLEELAGVAEAIAVAGEIGVPAQNFVCVDAAGRVGWTIIGRIPRRVGFDGRQGQIRDALLQIEKATADAHAL